MTVPRQAKFWSLESQVDIVVYQKPSQPPTPIPREHTSIWEADAPRGHISQLPWTSHSLWQILSCRIYVALSPPHSYPFLRLDTSDNLTFRDGRPSDGRSVGPWLTVWRKTTTRWETYILDWDMSEKFYHVGDIMHLKVFFFFMFLKILLWKEHLT